MSPRIKLIWDEGADHELAFPAYETSGAAGADIRANLARKDREGGITLSPGARLLVPTGFRLEVPTGFEAQIRPRSGLALHHGVTVLNTPGTIDSDYRGPVGILLINHGREDFTVRHGDRIAQMVIAPVVQARLEAATSLSATARGAAGYGSTGRG